MLGTSSRNPTIPFSYWTFDGEESGWSSTQTIIINEDDAVTASSAPSTPTPTPTLMPTPTESTFPSQNPTAVPIQPDTQTGFFGLSWEQITIVLVALVAVLLIVVGALLRKRARK